MNAWADQNNVYTGLQALQVLGIFAGGIVLVLWLMIAGRAKEKRHRRKVSKHGNAQDGALVVMVIVLIVVLFSAISFGGK